MVVSDSMESPQLAPAATGASRALVWHDLECGGYRADLALWRELAGAAPGGSSLDPILEVGAGSGRVALDLARAGHRVTALDLDPRLLQALSERAGTSEIEVVCADARSFELTHADFGLCLAPMQTIQLLGGRTGRVAFLRRAAAHLRPGGLLACAIVTDFEPFDYADGEGGPAAESVRVDGDLFVSRATGLRVLEHRVLIERERRVLPAARGRAWTRPLRAERPGVETGTETPTTHTVEHDVVELDRVSAAQLEAEAVEAGLRPGDARHVPATDEHLGSVVVILHA